MSNRDEEINRQLTAMGAEKALLLQELAQMKPYGPVKQTRSGLEVRQFSSRQKERQARIMARYEEINTAQNALLKVCG